MDTLMTLWVFCIGTIIGIIVGVMLSYRTAVTPLHRTIAQITTQPENIHERMKYYPYDTKRFHFLGEPVDGIQFEEEFIVFVRFKRGNIPRTKEQDHLKNLLENGKIRWFEFPIHTD